jgi:hypothetical protein
VKLGRLEIRSPFRWAKKPKPGVDGTLAAPPVWWPDFPPGKTVTFAGRRLQVVDRLADCVVFLVGNLTNAENKRRKAKYDGAVAQLEKQKKQRKAG